MPTLSRSTTPVLAALAVPALVASAARADELKIGSPAPAITVAKWVKGQPVKIEKGKVYVVEFWATWCGPCRTTIPHLTEMAKKYKGKVTFAGISISEQKTGPTDTSYIPKVAKFVEDMGAKMDYNVGVDGPAGTMSATWMDAAGQEGIPTAFIVGKDGNVAWIGHPMANMDKVLDQVVAGTFDAKAEAARLEQQKAEQEKAQAAFLEVRGVMQEAQRLAKEGKNAEALAKLDTVKSDNPIVMKAVANGKFQLLASYDEAAAQKFAKEASEGVFKDDGMAINNMAWAIVDPMGKMKAPDYDLALTLAKRAVELTKEDPTIMDTLATAYWRKGDLDNAIATQEKAVAKVNAIPDFPEELKTELKDRLAMFKRLKSGN